VGLQRPVMPDPAGTSRSQTATCGRSLTAFAEMVTLAGVNPGELASTVRFPAALVDCTRAMQRPENALRELPLSGSWLAGSPLPVPITLPWPETRKFTSLPAIGR